MLEGHLNVKIGDTLLFKSLVSVLLVLKENNIFISQGHVKLIKRH